jgi:hypothetical protein
MDEIGDNYRPVYFIGVLEVGEWYNKINQGIKYMWSQPESVDRYLYEGTISLDY